MRRSRIRPVSQPGSIVCSYCEMEELGAVGNASSTRCLGCGSDLDEVVLQALRGIVALPEARGQHACECGHPEMRHLPDGVYHCPACGAEVSPAEIPPASPVRFSRVHRPPRGRAKRHMGGEPDRNRRNTSERETAA